MSWYMSNNPWDLRIPSSTIMYINSTRHSMALNKPHMRGMSTLPSCCKIVGLKLGKSIPLFLLRGSKGIFFICQLYVDDIIFGSPNKSFNDEFAALMTEKFEMSMIGELKFFLGFEVKQRREEHSSTKPSIPRHAKE